MTKQAARAFLARWKALNEIERRELRETPMVEKFRQLEALMQSAIVFGWGGEDRAATEAVRFRWRLLRERYRA
jgi:hypothetical protein